AAPRRARCCARPSAPRRSPAPGRSRAPRRSPSSIRSSHLPPNETAAAPPWPGTGWGARNQLLPLPASVVVAGHLPLVGGRQLHPRQLADRVAEELDVAVGEAGVDAAGVPAARLGGHAVLRARPAAHAVAAADAGVPEAVAALHLVGVVQPVVRRRVAV